MKENVFLISIHCMTNKINLAAMNITKIGPCKNMSKKIDASWIQYIVVHFMKSYKNKIPLL